MKLLRFRIKNFRSVNDSGWIDVGDITALIGENEAGKTNVLLPLWKLNPAGDQGAIDPLSDFPRARYNDLRSQEPAPTFVQAEFELPSALAAQIANLTHAAPEEVDVARVGRRFDGKYWVSFPNGVGVQAVDAAELVTLVGGLTHELSNMQLENEQHVSLRASAKSSLETISGELAVGEEGSIVTLDHIKTVRERVERALAGDVGVATPLSHFQRDIAARFEPLIAKAKQRHPDDNAPACKLVRSSIPQFVYYSSYGNLDSEIYLPRVIESIDRLKRNEIGGREAAKARTLKVLFEFVRLSPKEILELGTESDLERQQQPPPSQEQIDAVARRKREREYLLMSASTSLTKSFRDWWKRGDYIFRFNADGNFFRIWVRDGLRPEEIELEYRSSGLQWFFSFYIVFLTERKDEHRDAVLLLDEPGVTLHPLAQEDLFKFFASLSASNQLLYTSHSAHLVDPDRLSDVRVVYVNERGETVVSADLRAAEPDDRRSRSVYPVDAALGLSVSRSLLRYAFSTIVEGVSDQLYLNYVRTRLIAEGRLTPTREMIFVPAGGARAVTTTASIVGAPDHLPPVILDGDDAGVTTMRSLQERTYAAAHDHLFLVDNYSGIAGSEIEDLLPSSLVVSTASKLFRKDDDVEFSDLHTPGTPIVPQIKAFANRIGLSLDVGWKVRLAHAVLARARRLPESVDEPTLERWALLFGELLQIFTRPRGVR